MNEEKKILVVDDEPDNASIFTMGLEDGGFKVDSFTDPSLALKFKSDHKKFNFLFLILECRR